MKKKISLLLLQTWAFLIFSGGFSLTAYAQASTDDVKNVVEDAMKKFLGDPKFIKECFGMTAEPVACDAADAPGSGLVCPPAGEAATHEHKCDLLSMASFKVSLGKKALQLLGASGGMEVKFSALGQEKSIPEHRHVPDGSNTKCSDKYIKRQEKVKVIFSAYQHGKIQIGFPDSMSSLTDEFRAAVEAAKGIYFEQGPNHFCVKVSHGEPLACGLPKPEKVTPTERTPVPTPGSRVRWVGEVVEDQPTTLSVVSTEGHRLKGVVVALNDSLKVTTDSSGFATFMVPVGMQIISAVIAGTLEPASKATVVSSETQGMKPARPTVTSTPRYLPTNEIATLRGRNFSGVSWGNDVKLGGRSLTVSACSPTELKVDVPENIALAEQRLIVANPYGESAAVDVTVISVSLEVPKTTLKTGETVAARLVVKGTEDVVPIHLKNLTSDVVRLDKGDEFTSLTSGGKLNFLDFKIVGKRPGNYALDYTIEQPPAKR